MCGIVRDDHLCHIAREASDRVEVGVATDRRDDVDAAGTGGLDVRHKTEVVQQVSDCVGSGAFAIPIYSPALATDGRRASRAR